MIYPIAGNVRVIVHVHTHNSIYVAGQRLPAYGSHSFFILGSDGEEERSVRHTAGAKYIICGVVETQKTT